MINSNTKLRIMESHEQVIKEDDMSRSVLKEKHKEEWIRGGLSWSWQEYRYEMMNRDFNKESGRSDRDKKIGSRVINPIE